MSAHSKLISSADICLQLAHLLKTKAACMASAESCTGGLIAAACTDLPGSSDWFERGFVSYSNQATSDMLGVLPDLIRQHGAVSEAVARAMAIGALQNSKAQFSVAVTGVAGPSGGSPDKPVGTVWLAYAWGLEADQCSAELKRFEGDRGEVRRATVLHALGRLVAILLAA